MLRDRMRDERGMAMIMSILVSMAVVSLGLVAMQNAVHNTSQSTYDRKRVQGVAAAEAGINYYMSHLQSVGPGDVQCTATQSLTGAQASSFTVTATYYNAAGNQIACPFAAGTSPATVLVRSVGNASTSTPARTMEAYIKLLPQQANPFGAAAIFSDAAPGLNSRVQVNGMSSDDADFYTNSSAVSSLSAGSRIGGSLYAQGSIVLNNSAQIAKDAWGKGSVTMNQNSRIGANATSSTSSISLSGGVINGNAKAGTTISISGGGRIVGTQSPNSPSPDPPKMTLPVFEFVSTDWTADGYTIHTYSDCNAARTFLQGITTAGKRVVRITANCTLNFGPRSNTRIWGDTAIITQGGFNLDARAQFSKSGTGSTPHKVFLFVGLNGSSPCDIRMNSNTRFGSGLDMLLYSPCTIYLASASLVVTGQMFAGKVDFNASSSINYKPIDVPGLGAGGFKEDIVYIREVVGG